MKKTGIINKGKLYDRILAKVIRKMSTGSVMLLNNDGLRIAEKTCGLSNSDGIWGSANRLIDAGERALSDMQMEKTHYVNQIFESEDFFLMVGPVNKDISYAILSSKLNKIPLGMLRLFADNLKEQVNAVDSKT
ncbi:MAG: hypothetical protein ACTSRS_08310 [Candidatus Helarchaeota archaeon]